MTTDRSRVISDTYRAENEHIHSTHEHYGTGAHLYVGLVRELIKALDTSDILDYGCGKGTLAKELGQTIHEYDPAIPEKSSPPEPADLVICACVLEHIEPEYVDSVLADLRRCTKRCALLIIPHMQAIDGGLHLSAHPREWWDAKLTDAGFQISDARSVQSICSLKPGEIMLGYRTFYVVR